MTTNQSFLLDGSSQRHRDLPSKLVLVHDAPGESSTGVLLKLLALDQGMMEELVRGLEPRDRVYWVGSRFDPAEMRFDFNGLWFDATFTVRRF